MTTVEDIDQWLKAFSYKPGWTFELTSPADVYGLGVKTDFFAVWIQCQQVDAYNPWRAVPVQNVVNCPLYFFEAGVNSREIFYDWLYDQVLLFEKHETDEWFRVDGVLIHDTHKKEEHEDIIE